MQLTVWTYEGPPHVGAMRVATGMKGLHYVLHAPQGDTYADLLFTMIERRGERPPVTYTTFQARDLGTDTAELFQKSARDAYVRFQPEAMIVGASCTAELIQDDPAGLALTMGLPCPIIALDLPSYSHKENWGAAETFYQIVRQLADKSRVAPAREGRRPRANLLGPTALGFRHRDDIVEVTKLLNGLGVDVHVCAPMGSTPAAIAGLGEADFNVVLYPEIAHEAARWLEKTFGQKYTKTVPIGVGATREFIAEVCAIAGITAPADADEGRMPWWSHSVDSTYLTGKRVFIFGDATHAIAAARIASEELGFEVVGLGCYNREFARDIRAAAAKYGVEPLITDDYLVVEDAIAAANCELVLGTQMERHIAKRLRLPCAVISAPVHVQDFPARHSPQMGFEGANVIFDTWVHPLVMGLEEHLLTMFRDDFEFSDAAGASHLGHGTAPLPLAGGERKAGLPTPSASSSKSRSSCAARRAATPSATPANAGSPQSPSKRSTRPRPIMRADTPPSNGTPAPSVRVVIITLDNHLSGAIQRARVRFTAEQPGVTIGFHAAADWEDEAKLAAARADIASGDIIISSMIFLEDHIRAIRPALEARREACDAMVCLMSAGEMVKLTRMGDYRMDAPPKGPLGWLKKLRGSSSKTGAPSSGAAQMAVLRRLPKLLKWVPGTAQDVRAYFLTMQYWLAGSDDNAFAMVRALVDRYAAGPRASLRGSFKVEAPRDYPDVGVYHPDLPDRMSSNLADLPARRPDAGTVGLVLLRSYVLGNDANHYDGVIRALEARGLNVIPAFSGGLDARPAIEALFIKDAVTTVDAVVNLTGFSLVGGPAYNDAKAAEEILARLDRPYIAAHPVEFQTLQGWGANRQGLLPIESTIMIAIPELDGGTTPMVFGGRSDGSDAACTGCARRCTWASGGQVRAMQSCPERAEALAARMVKVIDLRRSAEAQRKIGIVLFNFPPNGGAAGTAQFLAVFESLHATLQRLKTEGYDVDVPATADDVRTRILHGNVQRHGMEANVHAKVSADTIVAREPHLAEIEAEWGPAPGKLQSDGRNVFILGAQFGNVFVGIQPALGYEGDPMRLLFEGRFAPTHAFMAFYRWLRDDFGAHAVLHFGTHGSLEFMPGKQTGLTASCWPERLIGDLPNIYLYAANNPSEGVLAKRRSAATLVSYLTPALTNSGVYKGLADLKATVERWRSADPASGELATLHEVIAEQAAALDLDGSDVSVLAARLYEIERELIPQGLHVAGQAATVAERIDMLAAVAGTREEQLSRDTIEGLVAGTVRADTQLLKELAALDAALATNHELDGLVQALGGGYVRPVSGGDLLRSPEILPTGRNIHGFDPFRLPSAYAVKDGAAQAQRIIDRSLADAGHIPETVAMVLWGTDNLKSEGAQLAQAMALLGARPRFDSYNRLAGAELIPLAELGRPRIDVVVTLSGVFRDLLPLQTRMLAEAALLASQADEPTTQNFVRKHSLAHATEHGCDLETAALRVYSNAQGAYGANVNLLIDSSGWTDPDELADCFERQKGFAYGVKGEPVRQAGLLSSALKTVDCAYQNLESVELGITTIDQYVDTLGGISRAITRAKGGATAPVYIGDQTQGAGKVRSLQEQVALETRTRILNPVWTEGLLRHGYEGVRQIEAAVTTTMGWSATTGEVDPWVYQRITETYVLDEAMRNRIAEMNPRAAAKVANRLIEASERQFWSPDAATLAALYAATDAAEDILEGVSGGLVQQAA